MLKQKTKIVLFIFILLILICFYFSGGYKYLEFNNIKSNLEKMEFFQQKNPFLTLLLFSSLYILITALSIPGAIVLTLLSGTLFGVLWGTLIVSFASCIGASVAFLISRYLFRNLIMDKFENHFHKMNAKLKKSGYTYLFTLRLVPVSPFVLINLLMGLTSIKLWPFFWITYIGMLPGTMVYVFAGSKISTIQHPSDILTWPVILILTALGIMPFILKKIVTLGFFGTYNEQR